MNETIQPLQPIAPVEPTVFAYKDRSTGLVVFGILTLLLGILCGLLVPLIVFSQVAAARSTQGTANLASILPIAAVYGVMAVALIWLGIGSIKARRWARALLLIFSWSWLVMGIFMLVAMMFIMPKVLANAPSAETTQQHHALPPGALAGVMIFMFLFFGVFFVLLPAIWVFFYNSRHVKATCEARDGVTRWTDACPLPVLGLCVWVMLSVPMMLVMPLAGHGVMPFFGIFLSGVTGSLLCLLVAAIWAYAAWLMYQLKTLGWWLIMVAMILFMASSLLTYARHDVLEMYQLMGYPQAQIDQIQKVGLLTGNRMSWLMGLSALPFLIYVFFVKKYFPAKNFKTGQLT